MSEIIDLFKTPFYKTDLSLNNKEIIKYCLTLKKIDTGASKSNVGGWQSKDLKGIHRPLNELFEDIEYHANKFTNNIGLQGPVKIKNIWININGFGDSNMIHCHPHSLLSGVYYIKTPKDCGDIEFDHPCYNVFDYDWNINAIKETNTYTSPKWIMPSKQGVLYMFPSWLNHCVKTSRNKKEKRISIAFNIDKKI